MYIRCLANEVSFNKAQLFFVQVKDHCFGSSGRDTLARGVGLARVFCKDSLVRVAVTAKQTQAYIG